MQATCPDEKGLATYGRNALNNFQAACIALENNESTVSGQPHATTLRSEMQRFQLWAINLGLYRYDHGSLDYRLRENEIVKSFTRELLINLIESLEEIKNNSSAEYRNSPPTCSGSQSPDALEDENDESSSANIDRDYSSSLITMETLNDTRDENESMLILHLEDVTEAINQMYNLASQIRSPRSRIVRTDVDLYKEVADEVKAEVMKVREKAELQGIETILLQSRKSLVDLHDRTEGPILTHEDHCLIQRLQKANHTRRQQFEYWKRSKHRSIQAASRAIETIPSPPNRDKRLTNVLNHDAASLAHPSEATPSVLSSVEALPKDFVLKDSKSTYSGTSRGLTVHGPSGEKVNWPKSPSRGPLKEEFECPFCFYLCTPRYHEDAAWRTHLKHDLRPYVCTYVQCPEPNVLYDSWEQWTRHEQWAHQQRIWRCLEHPQHEYTEMAAYENHVKIDHAKSMHQMLSPELLKSQVSVSQECDRPCPFCQRDFERPTDMQQHLASHLETIALLSLPNMDHTDNNSEAEEVESNEANRNYAESRADDFDRTEPLVFRDNNPSEDTHVATEEERQLFKLWLKAENISFESSNDQEQNIAPSSLVQEETSPIQDKDAVTQVGHDRLDRPKTVDVPNTLIALAEQAQDISVVLKEFLESVDDLLREIAELIAECLSINSALRYLDQLIGEFPYHPHYPDISYDLTTVRRSLTLTFNNVHRIFGGLSRVDALDPGAEYGYVWMDLCDYFGAESGNTLRRRLDIYCSLLEGMSETLIEGLPRDPNRFDEMMVKVERLLKAQDDSFNKAFHSQVSDRSSSTSFKSNEPSDDQIPRISRHASPEVASTLVEEKQARQPEPLFDLNTNDSTGHWIANVYAQSRPETLLPDTEQKSNLVGEHMPGAFARLEESHYICLLELPFEGGDLLVRLYQRSRDGRSRIFCHIDRPVHLRKECTLPLVSLTVLRSGFCLGFYDVYEDKKADCLWARLRFPSFERLTLFFCSFLALRFEDFASPISNIEDYEIHGEERLFAGRIVDDHYEHVLNLFRDADTGCLRLQASVGKGELTNKPIWTAFINSRMMSDAWLRRESLPVICLADLEKFIFTSNYRDTRTPSGAVKLIFMVSSDAEDFIHAIEELKKMDREDVKELHDK